MIKISNSASNISIYTCQPKDREELEKIIKDRISKEGYECDLNDIDVSLIDDMSWLFKFSDFNWDISKWNTSNVKNMGSMFAFSKFNGDISNWKINKDCYVGSIFYDCPIKEEFKPKSLQRK